MTKHPLHLLAVCAALAAPALASPPCFAQQSDAASDAAKLTRSRQYFDQANKLYDEGKYPEAEQAYLAAWNLTKSYDVAGNLGMIEADLNHFRAAAEHLSYAIREFPAGGRPGLRDALIKRLADVRRSVGALRIQVNKPGAEVFVDGASVGRTPIPSEVFVEPGNHTVEVRLEGFATATQTLAAVRGQSSDVQIALAVPEVVTTRIGPNKAVLITGGVVGGAAVIAGAALMGVSASKGSSASTLYTSITKAHMTCPPASSANLMGQCATLASDLSGHATLGNAGFWLLLGGGVVGIGTIIYGVAGGRTVQATPATGVHVLPVVTGDGGGLLVNGTF